MDSSLFPVSISSFLVRRLLRPFSSFLLNHFRLFGWVPIFLYFLSRHPRRTALVSILWFHFISRNPLWISLVKQFCAFAVGGAASSRYKIVKTVELDPLKRYILIGNPHGLLGEGVTFPLLIDPAGMKREFPDLPYCAVGGTPLGFLPIFREIFDAGDENSRNRKLCTPDKESILRVLHEEKRSVGIFVGGFSEAVFTNPNSKVEYCYLKGRKGFIKLAIECGVDVVPLYSFGVTKLYSTPQFLRGLRSRLAQSTRIPMVGWFFGKFGTFEPKGDFTVYTVIGKPFPTSWKYSIDQIDEAHRDYCEELQSMYEANKKLYGEDRDLVFIGKDFRDNKTELPNWLRRMMRINDQFGIENLKAIEQWKAKHQRWKEISDAAIEKMTFSGGFVSDWKDSPHNLVVLPPELSEIPTDFTKVTWESKH